ncbi:MAG: AMP-binding protein [Pseudomonadota bacterium]
MNRLHQILENQSPQSLAVVDTDGRALSYATVLQEAQDLVETLRHLGVRPGDRVVLVAENCALYATTVIAASLADVWLILVNARQSAAELQAIVDHAAPRMILFTSHVSDNAANHAQSWNASKVGTVGHADLVATSALESTPVPVEPSADQVAVLLYTTGTTSAPKGVMLTHDNLIFSSTNGARYFDVRTTDQVLGVLPGTHIYALSSVFLNCMAGGASIRFVSRFDPAGVLTHLRSGVTRFPGVPQMFSALMAHCDKAGEPLGADDLRFLVTGGAPLDPGLKDRVERFFGLPLCNGYGITETSPSVASTHPSDPKEDVSVGPPYTWIETRIADPDEDGIGEVQVRGRNVMKGYFREPDKTAEAMTADGFFRTGDLGRIDETGSLHISGRLKELIIRSGFNVHPPEVEAMLSRHADVYSAAVVGRQVPGNEEIIAFVKTGGNTTGEELRAWLREKLVSYKVPQVVLVVDDWPAASTGKVLKHKLLEHFADSLPAVES